MNGDNFPGGKALARLSSRHYRKKNSLCLAEGLRCCQEALRHCQVLELYCSRSFRDSPQWQTMQPFLEGRQAVILNDGDFKAVSETETPQGILAVMRSPELTEATKAETPFTLILDRVADPGNLGTILRTAWAVGLTGCWLVKGCADPFSPKSIRAGMGAQFSLQLHEYETLDAAAAAARSFGVRKIWCTMPASSLSIFDESFKMEGSALVIGNEANGISDPSIGAPVTIPMPGGAESLNAAQAATIFLVESIRGFPKRRKS